MSQILAALNNSRAAMSHLLDQSNNVSCCEDGEQLALTTPFARQPFLQFDKYLFIMSISMGIICKVIAAFGILSNITNMIIFYKQGFQEPINISLFALAISDLCSLITLMWSNVCFTPDFRESGIPWVTNEVQLITGSWPHIVFTRITGWTTAFISFERCVCVVLPLKVKTLFTRKRHILAMVIIYSVTLVTHSMVYLTSGLNWNYYPAKNQSMVRLVHYLEQNKRTMVESANYFLNGAFMPVFCFLSVVTCSAFLLVKLNEKAAWRSSNSSTQPSTGEKSSSNRDQRVAKMIVLISVIFVACFIPAVILFIAGIIVPDLSCSGFYKNIFMAALSVTFITESINSSINTFIYFSMSTKFRETFLGVLNFRGCLDVLCPRK